MPRPKRYKVAPSVPVNVQQRVAKPTLEPSAAQKQQDIFSPESSGRVTNGSDDSDGLVVKKRIGASRRTPSAQIYTMSGALPPEDIGSTRLRPPSGQTRAALSRIVREADHSRAAEEKAKRVTSQAIHVLIPSSIPAKTVTAGQPSANSLGHPASRRSSQGMESRVPGTPQFQSSMLGAATFRKRPRQPSLLQMVQAHNNASDSLDEGDLYDFLPDDESTPLIKSLSQTNVQSKSSSQQISGSRKRKLATPEVQVPTSQPLEAPSSPSVISSQSSQPEDIPGEEEYPEPTLPRLRPTQTPQPQIFDDTLAPPQSSSPPHESNTKATRVKSCKAASKAKPMQQSLRRQLSPAPSPLSSTSTQVSPVRPAASKPLTTANLQNLLPRRRVRPRPKGDYDIPSSSDIELDSTGLGEDEDELSFYATSKMRRKKSMMPVQKSAAKAKHQGFKLGTGGKSKRVSKTYTRKTAVESENENDREDDAISDDYGAPTARGRAKTLAIDGKAKAEMERLAAKFREVDEFTLDFEDMTGSSSQMKDAR